MQRWLSLVCELTRHHSVDKLIGEYCQRLQETFSLAKVTLLVLQVDGRSLVDYQDSEGMAWSVDDFNLPFAHVVQTAKPMYLDAKKRVYWQDSLKLVPFLSDIQPENDVLIVPIHNQMQPALIGIALFVGSKLNMAPLKENSLFNMVNTVFVNVWHMLTMFGRMDKQRSLLKESIAKIEQKQQQKGWLLALEQVLVGSSEVMDQLRQRILTAAQSRLNVLIQGNTGVGKELIARAIHDYSSRRSAPFIAINCGAIPEHLLESELFGYEKGAFSGADKTTAGLVAQAHKGTLFLDEVGDMPHHLQVKLLRVLESRRIRPLGAKEEQLVDFRLVAATNVHLKEQADKAQFRWDLYYRLNQFPIYVPLLRERLDDLPLLIQHFITLYNQSHQTLILGIQPSALQKLRNYLFPGNVRELKNMIDLACANTVDGEDIQLKTFVELVGGEEREALCSEQGVSVFANSDTKDSSHFEAVYKDDLREALREFERHIICTRLAYYDGDRAKTAKSLGLPKRTLAHKCLKMEIE